MTKKIALIGIIAFVLVFGTNFTVKAETNNAAADIVQLKEKLKESEKKRLELEKKIMGTPAFRRLNVEDLDDADRVMPPIEQDNKGGPSLIIGPKGKATVWTVLTMATQSTGGATSSPWTLEGDIWGMKARIVTTASTKVQPEGATFKVGDRVAVYGTMANGVITATKIRNHSSTEVASADVTKKIQDLMNRLKELCASMPQKPAACANF